MKIMPLLFTLALTACATSIPPSDCKTRAGLINGPIVSEKETALAIAGAILSHDPDGKYELLAEEYAGYWGVSQALKNREHYVDEDTIIVTVGGGGGTMKIAKCDGRIYDFHYLR